MARREERVARPLKNERRDADGGKHASHVEIEPPTENARARCGWHRQDAIAREPREEGGIARQVRTRERHALIVLPLPSFGDEGNRLIHELSRKSSRVVFAPSGARPSFRDRERGRSLGMRRREHERHRCAVAEDRRPIGPGGIHHHTDVVHPLLERRQRAQRYGIGDPRAALVKHDQTTERRQPSEKPLDERLLPPHRDIRHPVRDENEIERSLADHLISDGALGCSCEMCLGLHAHPLTAKRRHSPGTPLSACSPRSSNSMPDPVTRFA